MIIRIFEVTRPVRMVRRGQSLNASNKHRVSHRHHLYQENKGRQGQSKLRLRARFRLLKGYKGRQLRNPVRHLLKTAEYKGMNLVGEMLLQMVNGAAETKADNTKISPLQGLCSVFVDLQPES
jgi:hypothetical protein